MIEQLTLFKPTHSRRSKLFFPWVTLQQMNWHLNTPLRIKPLIDGFGIAVHQHMLDPMKAIHFISKDYYSAPYLSIPENLKIETTLPCICGYIIDWHTHPVKLNIIFPVWLKKTTR